MTRSPLTAVRHAREKRERAEAEFRASLVRAHEAGHTLRAIAVEAGVSHARVFQIIRDA